jgi:hypothetical protein
MAVCRQRIEDLARDNGRLSAENEALRAQHAALLASTATERPDPSNGGTIRANRRSWRVYGGLADLGAVVATLAGRGLRVNLCGESRGDPATGRDDRGHLATGPGWSVSGRTGATTMLWGGWAVTTSSQRRAGRSLGRRWAHARMVDGEQVAVGTSVPPIQG